MFLLTLKDTLLFCKKERGLKIKNRLFIIPAPDAGSYGVLSSFVYIGVS